MLNSPRIKFHLISHSIRGGKRHAMYAWLDVHLKTCYATAMNERREILKQEKFANEGLELERFFKGMKDAKVAIEASYSWMPVYELLEGKGYEVKLAYPKETRIIAKAKVKTDKVDSERLAHLLRSNLLPTSYVPPKEIRELRDLVRLRTYLVRERTRFKNKIRAELAKKAYTSSEIPSPELDALRSRSLA